MTLRRSGGRALLEHGLELAEGAADADRLDDAADHLGGLVAVAGDADDDRLVAPQGGALAELAGRGDRHAASGFGENALGLGQEGDPPEDLVLFHRRAAASG